MRTTHISSLVSGGWEEVKTKKTTVNVDWQVSLTNINNIKNVNSPFSLYTVKVPVWQLTRSDFLASFSTLSWVTVQSLLLSWDMRSIRDFWASTPKQSGPGDHNTTTLHQTQQQFSVTLCFVKCHFVCSKVVVFWPSQPLYWRSKKKKKKRKEKKEI